MVAPQPPKPVQAGDSLSATWLNMLRDWVIGHIVGNAQSGILVSRSAGRVTIALDRERIIPIVGSQVIPCQITALANDYLTVRRVIDDGTMAGEAFDVAKPEKLRHDAAQYPGVTTLTTVDTNTADMSDGSTSETVYVTPIYSVGDLIVASNTTRTGVSVGGSDIKRIDINEGGRAWAWDGD